MFIARTAVGIATLTDGRVGVNIGTAGDANRKFGKLSDRDFTGDGGHRAAEKIGEILSMRQKQTAWHRRAADLLYVPPSAAVVAMPVR
ncbi:MAG: hypothetical protein WCD69_19680 [Xanthobacteraceae bacterium]